MKKIILIFSSILLSMNVFAHTGIMSGQKDLRISKTKYFDIIYAKGSEYSASLLFNNADTVYEELAQKLNLKHKFRLPVVVSTAQDDFNAYFSCGPFNHIVMFDTVCGENIAVHTDEFLMTFRHELTHAITYNLRNTFWYGLDKVLGDVYNPALLTITTAWAEGATVSIESENGEGRVNDPYATHMVRQAKAEENFPKYATVQGAKDVYPFTTESYMMGGMFNSWLQQEYGMEKYAEFWYRCVNLKNLTYIGAFKKVYGISIKKAWNRFKDSVELPEEIVNPEKSDVVETFKYGKKLSVYKAFSSWEKGFVWYDMYSASVNYFDGTKKSSLHKMPGIQSLSFSKDGRFIAEVYSSQNKMVPKNKIRIFDVNSRTFYFVPEESLRDGAIFIMKGEYFLAAVKTESQFSTIKIYKLKINNKNRIFDSELYYEEKFDPSRQIFSLEGTLDGKLFYILKDKMIFKICCLDLEANKTEAFFSGEKNFVIRGLNVKTSLENPKEKSVAFSYAETNDFPGLGFFDVENEKFCLWKTAISGGIYNPVLFGENNLMFAANYYDGFKIFSLKGEKNDCEECLAEKEVLSDKFNDGSAEQKVFGLEIIPSSKKFSSIGYNFTGPHGTIVPVGIDGWYSPVALNAVETQIPLLGATYVSSTPWTNPIWYVTGGYDVKNKREGVSIYFNGGSLTSAFSYTALAHVGFDGEGFKQTYENLSAGSKIFFSGVNYFYASESGSFIYDRDYTFVTNTFTAGLGNIYRSGFGYYDYSGIQFNAMLETDFYSLNDRDKFRDFYNLSFDLVLKNASILPVSLEGMLFPGESYLAAALAKVVLFNAEIQGAADWFPVVYFNRFSLSTSYLAKCMQRLDSWAVKDCWENLTGGEKSYKDELALTADFFVTPNLGGLTRFQIGVSNSVIFRFFPEEDQKYFQYSLGLKTDFSL